MASSNGSPRRTIWPTRDGWWCLFVVIGLGVAAINTGNNLLYLLVSLLLSLIVVSGVLSEQSLRGLRLEGDAPEEMYAGTSALFGAAAVICLVHDLFFTLGGIALVLDAPGQGQGLARLEVELNPRAQNPTGAALDATRAAELRAVLR